MSARLTLVSHAPTAATNAAAFAADEPLDERGTAWAIGAGGRLSRADRAICSPARACLQTAAALQLAVEPEPLLRDWELGRWRGRTLDEVAAAEPAAVAAWMTEPDAAPHGGERLTDLLARVANWLGSLPARGHTVAVTHPAVVRAAVVSTLAAGAGGFWRLDIAPLTATVLRGGPERWTVRTTGLPLVARTGTAGAEPVP
jgi:broad specificity phosphatase PhoE